MEPVTIESICTTGLLEPVCLNPKTQHQLPTPDLSDNEDVGPHNHNPAPEVDNSVSDESIRMPLLAQNQLDVNGKLQSVFESAMRDVGPDSLPHRKAVVLMISWTEELDDLRTAEEVEKLGDAFQRFLNYTVVKKQVQRGKPAQQQVKRFLLDFVEDYDGYFTLLLVYYAGHGIPRKGRELELTGRRVPERETPKDYIIHWSGVEPLLRFIDADVLLIFDCCYAGSLSHDIGGRGFSTRNFEFLGACDAYHTTEQPGPNSFTTALIWALKQLVVDQKPFTTRQLQYKIPEAPEFPKKQVPHLGERDEPSERCLVLGCIPKLGNIPSEEDYARANSKKNELKKEYLDLRFYYQDRPDEEQIRQLAQGLMPMIQNASVKVQSIAWKGHSGLETARKYTNRWRARTPTRHQKLPQLSIPPSRYPNSSITSAESPYATSEVSDISPKDAESLQTRKDNMAILTINSEDGHSQRHDTQFSVKIQVEDDDGVTKLQRQNSEQLIQLMIGSAIFGAIMESLRRIRPSWIPVIALPLMCAYVMYISGLVHTRLQSISVSGSCVAS